MLRDHFPRQVARGRVSGDPKLVRLRDPDVSKSQALRQKQRHADFRGPGVGSDTNRVPTSRAKPRDLRSTDEELTGSWYRVPKR